MTGSADLQQWPVLKEICIGIERERVDRAFCPVKFQGRSRKRMGLGPSVPPSMISALSGGRHMTGNGMPLSSLDRQSNDLSFKIPRGTTDVFDLWKAVLLTIQIDVGTRTILACERSIFLIRMSHSQWSTTQLWRPLCRYKKQKGKTNLLLVSKMGTHDITAYN